MPNRGGFETPPSSTGDEHTSELLVLGLRLLESVQCITPSSSSVIEWRKSTPTFKNALSAN